jgi:hypothetical protein
MTGSASSTAIFDEMLDDARMAKLVDGKTIAVVNRGITAEEAGQAIDDGYKTIVPDF